MPRLRTPKLRSGRRHSPANEDKPARAKEAIRDGWPHEQRFVAPEDAHRGREAFLGAVDIGRALFTPQWSACLADSTAVVESEGLVVDPVTEATWLKGAAPPIADRKKAVPLTGRGMMRRGECASSRQVLGWCPV